MILIIGALSDPHVQSVVKHLDVKKAAYSVLDRFNFKDSGCIVSEISNRVLLCIGNKKPLTEISSVWWRQKPPSLIPADNVSNYYDSVFSGQEWTHIFRFLEYDYNNIFSINNPNKSFITNNKLYQLKMAGEIGFLLPETIISNNYKAIKSFVESAAPHKVIFKTLNAYMNPMGLLTYTTLIDIDMLEQNKDSIFTAPGIYQKYIDKKYELRITVVGDQIFAAKVMPFDQTDNVDWREHTFKDTFEKFELNDTFRSDLLRLHNLFGLFYGAYDFIVNDNDEYVFLEVNPSGQWLWLEKILNFPISELIANGLIKGYE